MINQREARQPPRLKGRADPLVPAVSELVADFIADGVEAAVSPTIRETGEAVESLVGVSAAHETTVLAVAASLKLDKSTASRRVHVALDCGYLRNLEDRKGRPARLVLGEPLPKDQEILPTVKELARRVDSCTVAA